MADFKKTKALILLSGGLDSILAAKILLEQKIKVEAACFVSNFFGCEKAKKTAEQLEIPLMIIDISSELLELAKNPPSGRGKNFNPCVDCHALMFRRTASLAKKKGFDFIASGEVLGQRPFSQNRQSLARVAKLAGTEILRPLSARLLEETMAEKNGLVDRKKLLDIEGRSREKQFALAKKYRIKEYSAPAGGCLLTDPVFGAKTRLLAENWPDCSPDDVEIMKYGRIFWGKLNDKKILTIVGRNQSENNQLRKLAKKGDLMVELKELPGPLILVRIKNSGFEIKSFEKLITIPKKINPEKTELTKLENADGLFRMVGIFAGYFSTKARGKTMVCVFKTSD